MTHPTKTAPEAEIQPILDVQRRWVDAFVKSDTAALDTILAPGLFCRR